MGKFKADAEEIDKLVGVTVFQETNVLDGFSGVGFVPSSTVGFLELGSDVDQDVLRMEQAANVKLFYLFLSILSEEVFDCIIDEISLFEIFKAANRAF